MAVVGVYSSQIFSLCIGFGAALFRQTLKNTVTFNIYDFSQEEIRSELLTITLLGATFLTLLISFVLTKTNNWTLHDKIMKFLVLFYVGFFLVFALISFVG